MQVIYQHDVRDGGALAAKAGAEKLREALKRKSEVNIILATGLSQFAMLAMLRGYGDIEWERVNAFHLDEYIGLPLRHPASFRKILWEEFACRLPVPLKSFEWINGEGDAAEECKRLNEAIAARPIDIGFVGIGENGHLAFNDPPADFGTEEPYIVVTLDDACRAQQMGEGWFKTPADVPAQAISMSVRQIFRCESLIVTCPDVRKARAVKDTLTEKIGNMHPGTILRAHPDCTLFLDRGSASELGRELDASGKAWVLPVEKF